MCYAEHASFSTDATDVAQIGNVNYTSLQAAIDGQQKARAELSTDLPEKTWDFD